MRESEKQHQQQQRRRQQRRQQEQQVDTPPCACLQEKEHPKDSNAQLGETLHSSMVRAAVEDGLAHHTPETLHELMRTGMYKESEVDVNLDQQEKKVTQEHEAWSIRC